MRALARSAALLASVIFAAVCWGPSVAGASVPYHAPFLGSIPAHGTNQQPQVAPRAPFRRLAPSAPVIGGGDLTFHGGSVLHANRTHVIYWEPQGHSSPAGYKEEVDGFLGNVASASGSRANVYSIASQYTDADGNIAYRSAFAGSVTDTTAFPASGCSSSGSAVCLTDEQVISELSRVIAARDLPTGPEDVYVVLTPPGVGGCMTSQPGSACTDTAYCGYHSAYSDGIRDVLYANIVYGAINGCSSGQSPNGNPADDTINLLSHEHHETITDPYGYAWYDASYQEDGDKCAFDFGTSLGNTSSGAYNQEIGSGKYYLQREWSNRTSACELTDPTGNEPPAVVASGPASTFLTGQTRAFSAAGTTDSDGQVATYQWDFGDGHTATGRDVTHAFDEAGNHVVIVRVTDNRGAVSTARTTASVTDRPPVAEFTATPSASPTGTVVELDGFASDDPDGVVTSYEWDFGDGQTATGRTVAHSYSAPGERTVSLKVTDNDGSTSRTEHVVTTTNRPPVASFVAPTKPISTAVVAAFNAESSHDADGRIQNFRWDFGDGTTATGDHATHRFLRPGTYRTQLTVTDDRGARSSATHSVSVVARLPLAQLAVPRPPVNAGQEVRFDASGSLPLEGRLTHYRWRFGDGSTASGAQVLHIFPRPGRVGVQLTVTDASGAHATLRRVLTVHALRARSGSLNARLQVPGQRIGTILRRGLTVELGTTSRARAELAVGTVYGLQQGQFLASRRTTVRAGSHRVTAFFSAAGRRWLRNFISVELAIRIRVRDTHGRSVTLTAFTEVRR